MSTVSQARGDVIFTLLSGRLDTENASPNSFGLHVDAGMTAIDVQHIGLAHGFRLPPGNRCPREVSSAASVCYVQLVPGRNLAAVFEEILTTEPDVSTVNLNYVER